MVCFSVIIRVLEVTGLDSILYLVFLPIFHLLQLDTTLLPGMVHGFWEITLGIQTTAALGGPLSHTVALIAAILAWSGLSIQMQIAAITAPSGLSLKIYFFSRICQTILSIVAVLVFFPAIPTTEILVPVTKLSTWSVILLYWQLLAICFLLFFLMTIAGIWIRLLQKFLSR